MEKTDGSDRTGFSATVSEADNWGDRYDLQVHTQVSPCSKAAPEDIVEAARRRGLDGLAVTNHDTVEGYEAVAAVAGHNLDVIKGCEVSTTEGHLLALGVERAPPQADPETVVADVHDQGGVAVLSHPFDRLRERFEDPGTLANCIDGVEGINSRCVLPCSNRQAQKFATDHGLSVTAGSDAHFPIEIGRAVTVIESGRGPCEAVRAGKTRVQGRGGYLSGHVATKTHDILPERLSSRVHRFAPDWF